jgi:hypothetical protein
MVNGHAPLFAVPNEGKRSPRLGKRMKEQGLRAGVPDLFLAVRGMDLGGMFIEMKTPKGRLTDKQQGWYYYLKHRYRVHVCRSAQEVVDAVVDYMERESND